MDKNIFHASILRLTLLLLLMTQTSFAEEENSKLYKIDFDLFHSSSEETINPKIHVKLGPKEWETNEKKAHIGTYYYLAGVDAEFTHTWKDDLNNVPSWANLSTGLLWNISAVEEADGPPPGPDAVINSPMAYDYGKMGIRLQTQIETDDTASNVNWLGGGVLTYAAPPGAFDQWLPPLPALLIAFEQVKPQNDDARKALNVDDSSYPRFRGVILWNWAVGQTLTDTNTVIRNLHLQLHYLYFKEFDQTDIWKAKEYDEYSQINTRVRYLLPHDKRKLFAIREIYVGYSDGRQIDYAQNDSRVLMGITLQ